MKDIGASSSRKMLWIIYYTLYRINPQHIYIYRERERERLKHTLLHNNLNNMKIARPGSHLGAQQKRKVMAT